MRTLKCKNCGSPIPRGTFCNHSCAASYHNRVSPKRKAEGKCATCGKPLTTSRKFCSDSCRPSRALAPEERRSRRHARVAEWFRRVKRKAVALMGGKCCLCGYDKCLSALVFHHLDPAAKEFGIGNGRAKSWARTEAELQKCVLLCNRCHAEVHEGLATVNECAQRATIPQPSG